MRHKNILIPTKLSGIKPIILERGKQVEERIKDVEEFIKNKKFNISSNIQFGEGGAGTFSDGKLNTGNSSGIYSKKVLEEFESILDYLDNSHIKRLCGQIALEVIKEGVYYGYLIDSPNGILI